MKPRPSLDGPRVPPPVRYGLARATTGGLALLLLVVLTRVLTPEELGRYAAVVAAVSFAVAGAIHGVTVAIVRFSPVTARRRTFDLAVRRAVIRRIGLLAAAAGAIGPWTGWGVAGGALALAAGQVWYEVRAALAVADAAPGRYWALGATRGVAGVAGTAILGAYLRAPGALAGTAIGYWIAAALIGRRASIPSASAPNPADTASELRKLERFGAPLSVTAVLNTAVASGDRVLLAALGGAAAAGLYAPTYDLAQQGIWALMMIVNPSVYPSAVVAVERSPPGQVRTVLSRQLAALVALGLPAWIGLAVLASGVASTVLGPQHAEVGARLLPVLAGGVLLGGLKAFYVDVGHQLAMRPAGVLASAAVAAGVNIGLNLWLIPRSGPMGAAYATVGAYAVGLGVSWLMIDSRLPLPVPTRELAKTALATAVMAVALWPSRSWAGPGALGLQAGIGAAVYLAASVLLRSEGITDWLLDRKVET